MLHAGCPKQEVQIAWNITSSITNDEADGTHKVLLHAQAHSAGDEYDDDDET